MSTLLTSANPPPALGTGANVTALQAGVPVAAGTMIARGVPMLATTTASGADVGFTTTNVVATYSVAAPMLFNIRVWATGSSMATSSTPRCVVATNKVAPNSGAVATNNVVLATDSSVMATGNNVVATNSSVVATSNDVAATNNDVAALTIPSRLAAGREIVPQLAKTQSIQLPGLPTGAAKQAHKEHQAISNADNLAHAEIRRDTHAMTGSREQRHGVVAGAEAGAEAEVVAEAVVVATLRVRLHRSQQI